jgi:hypothetical protein
LEKIVKMGITLFPFSNYDYSKFGTGKTKPFYSGVNSASASAPMRELYLGDFFQLWLIPEVRSLFGSLT